MTSETRTWANRSGPATAGTASTKLAPSVAISIVADFMRKTLEITVAVIVRFRRPHRHCAMQLSPGHRLPNSAVVLCQAIVKKG